MVPSNQPCFKGTLEEHLHRDICSCQMLPHAVVEPLSDMPEIVPGKILSNIFKKGNLLAEHCSLKGLHITGDIPCGLWWDL